jgi:hypothetical protein
MRGLFLAMCEHLVGRGAETICLTGLLAVGGLGGRISTWIVGLRAFESVGLAAGWTDAFSPVFAPGPRP